MVFFDEVDLIFLLMKVKGVGEFGICGVVVVVVNVVYNVMGVCVWDYLIMLDKLLLGLLVVV